MAKKKRKLTDSFEFESFEENTTKTPEVSNPVAEHSQEIKEAFVKGYDAKYKKQTVNDTHTRTTFLLRNDLAERLNALSAGKRGFKTEFLNAAVEHWLEIIENE